MRISWNLLAACLGCLTASTALAQQPPAPQPGDAENMRRLLERIEQNTRPQTGSPYRAGIVAPPAVLTSPRPNLVRTPLSPYLNLARDQNLFGVGNNNIANLGINYYLGVKTEQARRINERTLADEITRQGRPLTGGAGSQGTTGHRTYFDSSYGRPAQQLYRR